jgi:DNA-binding transcriptional MerR regulator
MLADRTKLLSVSELASAFGLTPQALRFYETRGLLSPKRAGGTRVYDYRDHARLAELRRMRIELDDTIRELEDMKQDALARLKASGPSTGT